VREAKFLKHTKHIPAQSECLTIIGFFSMNRIVYAIHGGPMAGRVNYQEATYQ